MNNKINFEEYLQRYSKGILSEQEKLQLEEALGEPQNVEKLHALMSEAYSTETAGEFNYDRKKIDSMIQNILKRASSSTLTSIQNTQSHDNTFHSGIPVSSITNVPHISPGKRTFWPLIRYAAAAVFLCGIGLYILNYTLSQKQSNQPLVSEQKKTLVNEGAGANKAVLTLSNGQQVLLAGDGQQSITDKGAKIDNKDGTLSYGTSNVTALNTMTTPRGSQYKLVLQDGTKVWLNATSSITYPTSFAGNTREVSITGEAYFEVTKNALKPFIVKTYKDEIRVKGTSFNVNSYTDETDVKVSLLEGLVQIDKTLLKPGNTYMAGKVQPADMEKELAWKNGIFNFDHVKIKDAMRQISRWYDVDIRYEGNRKELVLGGEIGRNLSLQEVLNGLQDKDISFKLDGKTLTVSQQ